MKIGIQKTGLLTNQSCAIISHGDKSLTFSIKFIDKASLPADVDIFEQINSFWQTMSTEELDVVFDTYTRIRAAFNACWDNSDLAPILTPLVAELTALHDLEKIRYWMDYKSNLLLPQRLDEKFSEQQQSSYTRDKTYLKEDYQQLVSLSIAIRTMIPIWGEFVMRTEDDNGTQWKEYWAYNLLEKSTLMESAPMLKLLTYVESNVNTDKVNTIAILKGVSSVDFPGWVTGLVVVRRLGFGDIRGVNPMIHLVTQISGFIGTVLSGQESRFKSAGMVKPKIIEGQGSSDSESNLSKLEGVKVKESVPAGNIVPIDVFTDDVHALAKKLCPSLDMSLLRASLESSKIMENEKIWPAQRNLIQTLVSSEVSTHGFKYLDHMKLVKLMAVAQAILWHRKFYDLAILVSAASLTKIDVSSMEGRARIPKDKLDELDKHYRHPRRASGKKADKGKNPAVVAIEMLEVALSSNVWRPTLPIEWLQKLPNQSNQTYYVPYEIKVKLAEFSIAIATKDF